MIYRIKNLWLRRAVIVIAFPFICLALFLAWMLDCFNGGFKGFKVYAKDATEEAAKGAYELGYSIREIWNNE